MKLSAIAAFLIGYCLIQVMVQYTPADIIFRFTNPLLMMMLFTLAIFYSVRGCGTLLNATFISITLVIFSLIVNMLYSFNETDDNFLRVIYFISIIPTYVFLFDIFKSPESDPVISHYARFAFYIFGLYTVVRMLIFMHFSFPWNANWSLFALAVLYYAGFVRNGRHGLAFQILGLSALTLLAVMADTRGMMLILLLMVLFRLLLVLVPPLQYFRRAIVGVFYQPISAMAIFVVVPVTICFIMAAAIDPITGRIFVPELGQLGLSGNFSGRELSYAYFFESFKQSGHSWRHMLFGDIYRAPIIYSDEVGLRNPRDERSYIHSAFLQVWFVYGILVASFYAAWIGYMMVNPARRGDLSRRGLANTADRIVFVMVSSLVYKVFDVYHTSLTIILIVALALPTRDELSERHAAFQPQSVST